jgi:hypothetical protein
VCLDPFESLQDRELSTPSAVGVAGASEDVAPAERALDDAEELARLPRRQPRSRVVTAHADWHVSARQIRTGAGLLAASAVIQLWSLWLGYFAPDAPGEPSRAVGLAALFLAILGVSTWLLAQPWRRRVMVFDVVVTTLWTALLALSLAVGTSDAYQNNGLELVVVVIGGLGLLMLPFAEVWARPLAAILRVAAGMTLLVGLTTTIFGGAHLLGVLGNYSRGAYPVYDFRVASMISIGIMMVVAGTLCIAVVRGLARGRRRAWDIAIGGTALLLLVTLPLLKVPVQGQLAEFLTFFAAPNLIVLVVARRRLETVDAVLAGGSGNSAIGLNVS